mgnify:CR=1 FL=1
MWVYDVVLQLHMMYTSYYIHVPGYTWYCVYHTGTVCCVQKIKNKK